MKILNPDYSYNTTSFKGSNGTWKLVGTDGSKPRAKDAIDTFLNTTTKQYLDVERFKVLEMQQKGLIDGIV